MFASLGHTPRGSCNRTLLRRVLRRFSNGKRFLEGFLERACRGFSLTLRKAECKTKYDRVLAVPFLTSPFHLHQPFFVGGGGRQGETPKKQKLSSQMNSFHLWKKGETLKNSLQKRKTRKKTRNSSKKQGKSGSGVIFWFSSFYTCGPLAFIAFKLQGLRPRSSPTDPKPRKFKDTQK